MQENLEENNKVTSNAIENFFQVNTKLTDLTETNVVEVLRKEYEKKIENERVTIRNEINNLIRSEELNAIKEKVNIFYAEQKLKLRSELEKSLCEELKLELRNELFQKLKKDQGSTLHDELELKLRNKIKMKVKAKQSIIEEELEQKIRSKISQSLKQKKQSIKTEVYTEIKEKIKTEMGDSYQTEIECQLKDEVRKELITKLKKEIELEFRNEKKNLNPPRPEIEIVSEKSSSNIASSKNSSISTNIRFKKVSTGNTLNTCIEKSCSNLNVNVLNPQTTKVQTHLLYKASNDSCIKLSNVPREVGIGKRLMEHLTLNFGPVLAARVLWYVKTDSSNMNVFITFWHQEHCSDFLKSLRKSHSSCRSEFFYFDFPYSYNTKQALIYVSKATNKVVDFKAIYPNGQEDIKLVTQYICSNNVSTKNESLYLTNEVFYAPRPKDCDIHSAKKRKLLD